MTKLTSKLKCDKKIRATHLNSAAGRTGLTKLTRKLKCDKKIRATHLNFAADHVGPVAPAYFAADHVGPTRHLTIRAAQMRTGLCGLQRIATTNLIEI